MAKAKVSQNMENVHVLSDVEHIMLDNYNNVADVPIFDLVKSETVGNITRDYIEVPITTKDDNGEKVVVYRKCSNALAVSALSTIGMLGELRKKSLKMLVLGMAKITDEQAQAVDKSLKTARALIKAMYPEYSDNTINKYRRIGLLFGNDCANAKDYEYNSFIEADVSISNLDVVLTLFDKFDVEKASTKEREVAVSDFYAKYIMTDMIHLHASQSVLKKEVHDILNPPIDGTAIEIDEQASTGEQATQATQEQASTGEQATQASTGEQASADSTAETAQHSIATLSVIFKGNKAAEDAIAILMQELSKLF